MNALTSRPGTPPDSDLISLAEPETEVLQVLHPDVTVSILVTHVENLLESPQKLQQLLLVGKNASFHFRLVRTCVPPNVNQLLEIGFHHRHHHEARPRWNDWYRRCSSGISNGARRRDLRKRATIYDSGTRHCVTSQLLINNTGVMPRDSKCYGRGEFGSIGHSRNRITM